MNISAETRQRIERMEPGQIFGYGDIPEYQSAPDAVVKAVNRLVKDGEIRRLSKGKFYTPLQGIAGESKPSDQELLKTILYKKGKQLIGYVTGAALYNQLGLTTQVPRTITVAIDGSRQKKDFGTLRVKLVKSRAPVKAADIRLLQYLDVLWNIKQISNVDINVSLSQMAQKISRLNDKQVKRIQHLVKNYYPAGCRALLGLLLEANGQYIDSTLRTSLNPASRYFLAIDTAQWPNISNWNIKTESRLLSFPEKECKMDELVERNRQKILMIARETGVRNIKVFGSMARNEANEKSDLDLLVELEEGRTGFALGEFLEAVSDLVHRKVDVVTEKSLHPVIHDKVMREAIPL